AEPARGRVERPRRQLEGRHRLRGAAAPELEVAAELVDLVPLLIERGLAQLARRALDPDPRDAEGLEVVDERLRLVELALDEERRDERYVHGRIAEGEHLRDRERRSAGALGAGELVGRGAGRGERVMPERPSVHAERVPVELAEEEVLALRLGETGLGL